MQDVSFPGCRAFQGPLLLLSCLLAACAAPTVQPADPTGWERSKAAALPEVILASEFEKPQPLPMATLAWEDGVWISRDGLSVYAIYMPFDVLKAVLDGVNPDRFQRYRRGPDLGQDFSNPFGSSDPWLHADIVRATRSSPDEAFGPWQLTNRRGRFHNQGAPVGIRDPKQTGRLLYAAWTDDSSGSAAIRMARDTDPSLDKPGDFLPPNVLHPDAAEDNPHLEMPDPEHPERIVLLFQSPDRPGGMAERAIWTTTSENSGQTWSDPVQVIDVETPGGDPQPHLFHDSRGWWLYHSVSDPADGKRAIFRAPQTTAGDWTHWGPRQRVVAAGSSAGIGEPTLTASGDLCFVTVVRNPEGTAQDMYDSDPWLARRKAGTP